jgi:hypothetical protein
MGFPPRRPVLDYAFLIFNLSSIAFSDRPSGRLQVYTFFSPSPSGLGQRNFTIPEPPSGGFPPADGATWQGASLRSDSEIRGIVESARCPAAGIPRARKLVALQARFRGLRVMEIS